MNGTKENWKMKNHRKKKLSVCDKWIVLSFEPDAYVFVRPFSTFNIYYMLFLWSVNATLQNKIKNV